jgi:hypothetical protein
VAGKKIVVIEKDDQGKPDLGKSLLAAAYGDDKVDLAVGPTASGVALAMLPVAEEYKKILLVEPAVADASPATSGTNTSSAPAATAARTPSANAVALDKDGNHCHAGAGLRLRPRWREGLQGVAQKSQDRARGIPARPHHRLHRRRCSA